MRAALATFLLVTLACCLPGIEPAAASDASAANASSTATAAAAGPIRIGVTVSQTGRLAGFAAQQLHGMRQFVHDINHRGQLLGRPVELVSMDDGSTVEGAKRAFQELAGMGITLFVSPYSSTLTLALREQVHARDVAMVSVASAPEIWDRPNPKIFGLYTPADNNMLPVLRLAQDRGLKRLALIYQDSEFPRAVAAGVRRRVAEYELQVALDRAYDPGSVDYDALAAEIGNSDPDVVIVGSYLRDAVAFTRAARGNGVQPAVMAFSGGPALREFGNRVGFARANGLISTVQWMRSVRFPGSFDFGFRYRDRHGIYPSYDAAGGYAALQVLEAAVRLAGTDAAARVRGELLRMKFRSIIGHYRVDAFGRQTAKSTYLVQWQDAHISLVYPPEVARWPLRYPLPAAP